MNIFLWVLQVILALHTLMGAIWKFSKTAEQSMPTLKAIPNGVWMGMGIFEIICAAALILPFFSKPLGSLAPIAAICIAVEMLIFSGIHISHNASYGPVIYWLIVAVICIFISYGRLVLKPF